MARSACQLSILQHRSDPQRGIYGRDACSVDWRSRVIRELGPVGACDESSREQADEAERAFVFYY